MKVEMLVRLRIPDTTAITAKQVLERMGLDVGSLKRADYYMFEIGGDEKEFSRKIAKVDVLVNSNKHIAQIGLSADGMVSVLVKNSDDKCEGLMHTLTQRLGMKEIKSIQRGVLWTMDCGKETAKKATEQLLYNRHFQEYKIIGGAE